MVEPTKVVPDAAQPLIGIEIAPHGSSLQTTGHLICTSSDLVQVPLVTVHLITVVWLFIKLPTVAVGELTGDAEIPVQPDIQLQLPLNPVSGVFAVILKVG